MLVVHLVSRRRRMTLDIFEEERQPDPQRTERVAYYGADFSDDWFF